MKRTADRAYLALQDALRALPEPTVCSRAGYDYFFFPESPNPDGRNLHTIAWREELREIDREAKAICTACPVRDLCADYAIVAREEFGTWGGITADERKEILSLKKLN